MSTGTGSTTLSGTAASGDKPRNPHARLYRFGEKPFTPELPESKKKQSARRCVLLYAEKSAVEKQSLVAAIRADEQNRAAASGTGLAPVQPYQIQNALMPEQFLFIPDGTKSEMSELHCLLHCLLLDTTEKDQRILTRSCSCVVCLFLLPVSLFQTNHWL